MVRECTQSTFNRRGFLRVAAGAAAGCGALLAGCSSDGKGSVSETEVPEAELSEHGSQACKLTVADLPPAQPDPASPFGVDLNINVATIDSYLDIPGVAYRDLRMVFDPARYEEIGGMSELSLYIPGFKVVPYPYLGTLAQLPVSGAYDGDRLFDVTWGEGLTVQAAAPRYAQAMQVLEELFPKDAPIILTCGGGGYAAMTKALLTFLGWDPARLYVMGAMWEYNGQNPVLLVSYADRENPEYYLWRADVANIDFAHLR